MSKMLQIEVAEDVLLALQQEPEDLARDMRLAAAAKWYELGRVSQDKAAEIAAMSRADFMVALSRLGVSPFQESPDEILSAARSGAA